MRREEQLLAALTPGPRSVADLARDLYKGLLPEMMRFAELQVLAGLLKLKADRRAIGTSESADSLWSGV
jgi:hypothetical protein